VLIRGFIVVKMKKMNKNRPGSEENNKAMDIPEDNVSLRLIGVGKAFELIV